LASEILYFLYAVPFLLFFLACVITITLKLASYGVLENEGNFVV